MGAVSSSSSTTTPLSAKTPYFDEIGKEAKTTDAIFLETEVGLRSELSPETVVETMLIGRHGPRVTLVHEGQSGIHGDVQIVQVNDKGKQDGVSPLSCNASFPIRSLSSAKTLFSVDVGVNAAGWYGGLKHSTASYAAQARHFRAIPGRGHSYSTLSLVRSMPFKFSRGVKEGDKSNIENTYTLTAGVQVRSEETNEFSSCAQISRENFAVTAIVDQQKTDFRVWEYRPQTETHIASIVTFPSYWLMSRLRAPEYSVAIEQQFREPYSAKARLSTLGTFGLSVLASPVGPISGQVVVSAQWQIQDRTLNPNKVGFGLMFGSI